MGTSLMLMGLTTQPVTPPGHLVDIGKGLVVDLEEAGLQVLAHLELGGDHGVAVAGHGVEVLQALHLPKLLLQIDDRQVFHFLGRGAGHTDEDVHHGHGDLGVFFTRREYQGRGPSQQADDDNQGGQLRFDEPPHQAGSEAEMEVFG